MHTNANHERSNRVTRFRQTTHHKQATRQDRVRHAARVAALTPQEG